MTAASQKRTRAADGRERINSLLEDFEGAAHAEATVLESSSRGHLVGQGRIAKDIPKARIAEAARMETFSLVGDFRRCAVDRRYLHFH